MFKNLENVNYDRKYFNNLKNPKCTCLANCDSLGKILFFTILIKLHIIIQNFTWWNWGYMNNKKYQIFKFVQNASVIKFQYIIYL